MNKTLPLGLISLLVASAAVAVPIIWNTKGQNQAQTAPVGSISTPQNGHKMSGTHELGMSSSGKSNAGKNEHSVHGAKQEVEKTQVKLTKPWIISQGKSMPLKLDVTDRQGKAIAQFDTFQEKLMHLIVVSNDLQFFDHIHPEYKGKGRFEVSATFPQTGSYTLFSDYKPTGQAEEVSVLKVQTTGSNPPTPTIDLSKTKTFGETKTSLEAAQPAIKAGEEVMLNFDLKEAANGQPVKDLQPYLGEQGHLVILKQSTSLTRADYIHAHAMKDTPTGQVSFMATFPQAGKYKLWGQFNRNGKIVITDFWVNVL